jgi:ABC-type amino acid transport substrate-binding protein
MSVAVPRIADADADYRTSQPYAVYRQFLVVRGEQPPLKSLGDLMQADQALLDRVNSTLARMRESGIIAATLERYGIVLEQPGEPHQSANR